MHTVIFYFFYSTDRTAPRPGCFILLSGFQVSLAGNTTSWHKSGRCTACRWKIKGKEKKKKSFFTVVDKGCLRVRGKIYKRAPADCSGAPTCRKGTGGSPLEGTLLCFTIQVDTLGAFNFFFFGLYGIANVNKPKLKFFFLVFFS